MSPNRRTVAIVVISDSIREVVGIITLSITATVMVLRYCAFRYQAGINCPSPDDGGSTGQRESVPNTGGIRVIGIAPDNVGPAFNIAC